MVRQPNTKKSFFQGQEKVPTNWIREKDHEVVAFPEIFPNGANGFNDKTRPKAISRSDYFCQRFMNNNKHPVIKSMKEDFQIFMEGTSWERADRHPFEKVVRSSGC